MGFFKALGDALKLHPKTKEELKGMVGRLTSGKYPLKSLNSINVSSITDMSHLFEDSEWDGDISSWDVSHVTNMECMFKNSKFNGDISKWDVSNVQTMEGMFMNSEFNGDICGWDVSNVENMKEIFKGSKFKGNIFNWHVDKIQDVSSLWDGGWSPEDSQMLKKRFSREATESYKSEKQSATQEPSQKTAKDETVNPELNEVFVQFGSIFGGGLGRKSAAQSTEIKKDSSESNSKSAGNFSGVSGNYFIDSRDGQKYRTVKIGNQIWMAENLRYKCKSGCYAYRDDESNVNVMGRLYEWDVAENACPPGWHLPDDNEWLEFKKNTGLYEAQQDEVDNSFRKIIVKPWAENLEILPHLDETLPPSRYRDLKEKEVNQQLKEINSLKVSLVPSGRRDYDAYGKPYYSYYGINAYFWSATLCEDEISIGKYERKRQYLCFGEMSKWTDKRYDEGNVPELAPYPSAFSIRCVKD